jgi:hypothetical protein
MLITANNLNWKDNKISIGCQFKRNLTLTSLQLSVGPEAVKLKADRARLWASPTFSGLLLDSSHL